MLHNILGKLDNVSFVVNDFPLYDFISITEEMNDMAELKAQERTELIFKILTSYKNIYVLDKEKEPLPFANTADIDCLFRNNPNQIYECLAMLEKFMSGIYKKKDKC